MDLWFWLAVVCYVILVPGQIAMPTSLAPWWFIIDFLLGTALLCVWIEKKWNTWRRTQA